MRTAVLLLVLAFGGCALPEGSTPDLGSLRIAAPGPSSGRSVALVDSDSVRRFALVLGIFWRDSGVDSGVRAG
jgi:hypothetical protein